MKADFIVTTNELDDYYLMYFHPSIQEIKSQHPDWSRLKCLSSGHVTYSWVESDHVKYKSHSEEIVHVVHAAP